MNLSRSSEIRSIEPDDDTGHDDLKEAVKYVRKIADSEASAARPT